MANKKHIISIHLNGMYKYDMQSIYVYMSGDIVYCVFREN